MHTSQKNHSTHVYSFLSIFLRKNLKWYDNDMIQKIKQRVYSSIDWHLFPFFLLLYLLLSIFLARVRFFFVGLVIIRKIWSWDFLHFYTLLYLISQQGKNFYVIPVFSCFDFDRFYWRDTIFKNLNVLYEFNCPRWPSGLWHLVIYNIRLRFNQNPFIYHVLFF